MFEADRTRISRQRHEQLQLFGPFGTCWRGSGAGSDSNAASSPMAVLAKASHTIPNQATFLRSMWDNVSTGTKAGSCDDRIRDCSGGVRDDVGQWDQSGGSSGRNFQSGGSSRATVVHLQPMHTHRPRRRSRPPSLAPPWAGSSLAASEHLFGPRSAPELGVAVCFVRPTRPPTLG